MYIDSLYLQIDNILIKIILIIIFYYNFYMLETETIPITQQQYYKQNNTTNDTRRQSKSYRSFQKIQGNQETYITPSKHSLEKKIITYQTTVQTSSSKSPVRNNQLLKNKGNMLQPKGKPTIFIQNLISYRKERNSNDLERFEMKQESQNTQTKNSSKAQLQDSMFHLKKVQNPTKQMNLNIKDFKMEKYQKSKQSNSQSMLLANLEHSSPSFSNILQDFKNQKIEESKVYNLVSPKYQKDFMKKKLIYVEQKASTKQSQQYKNNISLERNKVKKQQDYKSDLADIYNGKFKISKINR